jgi:exonuclease SbcD
MTRIAFTADWHVDEYGTRVDPASGLNARLADYLATADYVVGQAAAAGATALVIAGDLTERRHPSPWLVARIVEVLDRFPELVVALRGNHDGAKAGRSIIEVLDGRPGIVGVSTPRIVEVEDVSIACIPHVDRNWLRAQPGFEAVPDAEIYGILAEQFLVMARGLYAEARRDYPDAACVLICHATLSGAQMSESQQAFLGDVSLVVDARALEAIGYEGIVAGHLHRHQTVLPNVLYAGSIERVDFGEASEAKGFIVADVEPGRFDWEFIETPARRFVTLRDRCYVDLEEVRDAVVRCVDVDPELDPANLRKVLEESGAFEVQEIRVRRSESTAVAGGLSESLSASQALDAYFAETPDAEPIVARGREILAAVS